MKTYSYLRLAFAVLVLAGLSLSAAAWEPQGNNIKTRWAAQVSPQNARPEYPRPQLVRPQWQCLNGLWDYALSPADAAAMPAPEGEILVPFCIESALSGVGKRVGKEEALWYARTLELPRGWKDKRILLHFDAVDWQAEVFLNGQPLGRHTGGFTAFCYDVTESLQQGPARLEVKVWDPSDDPAACIPRGKQVSNPSGIWYTPVTGIWQSVWLEAVSPEAYIADYQVVCGLSEGRLIVNPVVAGAQEGDIVQVDLLRPRIGYSAEKPGWALFRKGRAYAAAGQPVVLQIRKPRPWSPDAPWLYGLRITLRRGGKVIDRVQAYTAFREISVKADAAGAKRLALNDAILFQYGPLDQGWWPDGLYTAPTAQAMAFDIEKTKELGFNMIRKHIKVEPARWYYDCDRLGMLVWQDMPSVADHYDWGQGRDYYGSGSDYPLTQAQKDNYYKEWGEIIAQRKKFPCIVVWVPFNEAWGQFDTKAVCQFTFSQDPTRLINAASGANWVKGAGDILDSHTYPHPRLRILDPDMVNVLGEYGGIGRPIEGHTWEIGKKWGYVQYDTEEKVTDTYVMYARDVLDIKQLDGCAAAVYTQTTDVEGEVNGFYTYDREVLKVDAARVREANRQVIEAPEQAPLPLARPSAFHYKDEGMPRHLNLFTLRRGDLTAQVTEYGARLVSLFTPDREGRLDDVVVGYDDAERFVHNRGERFLGATVGRVANRIAGARFTLDGVTWRLADNDQGRTLHGGFLGVDRVLWKVVERTPWSITMAYTVPDGQDGFPGNLNIRLTYALTEDNALDISYSATTDKATPVNLSNHAFYNLQGRTGTTILDHVLTIPADAITPVGADLIPTGEFLPVAGTPFDFREPHAIGERIGEDHAQLAYGAGYDHNWVLSVPSDGALHKICEVYEPVTGRVMEIESDQPGLQFYSGNFFDGSYAGKDGQPIGHRGALVLEPQKFPDAVHHTNFPGTILRPGETYTQHSVYRFGAR